MPVYQIFPDPLTDINSEHLDGLPLAYNKYLLGIACANNEGFTIVTLQLRFLKTDPWQIVASNLPSQQGQRTAELGYLNAGTLVSVFWVVRAVTKIASVSVYLVNDFIRPDGTRDIRKIAPATPPKKMEHGEDWGDEVIDITLF